MNNGIEINGIKINPSQKFEIYSLGQNKYSTLSLSPTFKTKANHKEKNKIIISKNIIINCL